MNLRDEYHHILGMDNVKIRPHISIITKYLYQQFKQGKSHGLNLYAITDCLSYCLSCRKSRMESLYAIIVKTYPKFRSDYFAFTMLWYCRYLQFKSENYETSQAIGKTLFNHIEQGNFDFVISECETCKWQIDMSTSKTCLHPVTLLAMALK